MKFAILRFAITWMGAAGFAWATVGLLRPVLKRLQMNDVPNHRSLHQTPVLRGGGIAIVFVALVSWIALGVGSFLSKGSALSWLTILLCALTVATVGFVDDYRGLSAKTRLLVHLAASALLVWSLEEEQVSLIVLGSGIVLTLATAWMINLTNFMDGIDGILGTQLATTSLVLGVYALGQQDYPLSLAFGALGGACLGFLFWNWSPARVFCGDAGSGFLGFYWAALALLGVQRGTWDFPLPLIAYSVFIADATLTLLRRLIQRKNIFAAHREHVYQRWVLRGAPHSRVSLAVAFWNLGVLGSIILWIRPRWLHF